MYVTGSHRDFALGIWYGLDGPNGGEVDLGERYGDDATEDHGAIAVGDVSWHHGWTLHAAPPLLEEGAERRLAYAVTYIRDGAMLLPEWAPGRPDLEDSEGYGDWLDQLVPGTPAVHEKLPVVWGANKE